MAIHTSILSPEELNRLALKYEQEEEIDAHDCWYDHNSPENNSLASVDNDSQEEYADAKFQG